MDSLWQDIRYGLRVLLKSPGLTAVAVIALALGIGANTAIFSVVNALLLESLPYRDAERIVILWEHSRRFGNERNVLSPANFIDWREQSQSFEEMALFFDARFNLTGGEEPVELPGQAVTPNLFTLLGVEPILGRNLTAEDAAPDAPNAVVISYGLWQSRYGGDPGVIGRQLTLNTAQGSIVGVLPAGFQWHIQQNSQTGTPADIWVPFPLGEDMRTRRGRFVQAVGRLREGVSLEQARAEMNTIAARLEQQHPNFNANWGATLVPLREQLVGDVRPALWIMLGAVGFVLLIACANVANLLLARAAARQKEFAIRTALGAGRRRVIRQLLTESVLLSTLGGALGLLLAWWGVEALVALSPRELVNLESVRLSLPVLGFTLGVSFFTGLVFGLAPALEAARLNTSESLKEGGRGTTAGGRSRRLRSVFVVAEIALALVLLVSAGLLVRSFIRLQAVDPGFRADNLLTMRVQLPRGAYQEDQRAIAFYRQAVERIGALPGVASAGAVSYLPFTGIAAATRFTIEGRPEAASGEDISTEVRVTSGDYFRAMNIPLLRGRLYNEQEMTESRHVIVINEAMARTHFPNEDPLGRRITVTMSENPVPSEIIGIVGDSKHEGLDKEARPTVFWPHPELSYRAMTIVARTAGDPLALAQAAQREIQAIDPNQPVSTIRTMEQWLAESVARARFNTLLLGLFAALAFVLAAVGIFGVMSYTVTQRTHEIGLRMALGAQSRDVLLLIVGQGLTLTLVGVGLGLAGAYALTRLLASLLFGVTATDPVTYGVVAALLLAVALLACYIPARRATKVDPMEALRYE